MSNAEITLAEITEKDKVRFWSKVDKNGPEMNPVLGPCWIWTGSKKSGTHRYGYVRINRKMRRANRMAFLITFGTLTKGREVLHKCDNPPCCNPEHLFEGSHTENMRDMIAKGRSPSGDRSGARKHPETILRGELSNGAKLKEVDVLEIRRLCAIGFTNNAVAEKFGMDGSVISRIKNRKTWTHVPEPLRVDFSSHPNGDEHSGQDSAEKDS